MVQIQFTVPAVPKAQPRQRQRVVKKGDKSFVMNYTPQAAPVQDFKATVRMAAREAYDGPPLDGPLRCDLTFVFPRTLAQTWKTRPMPRLGHDKKPDRDNLDKAVMDSLTGLLWVDDAQICDGRIMKLIASGDEQPHVLISVSRFSLEG